MLAEVIIWTASLKPYASQTSHKLQTYFISCYFQT
jgi:hypothetical protein